MPAVNSTMSSTGCAALAAVFQSPSKSLMVLGKTIFTFSCISPHLEFPKIVQHKWEHGHNHRAESGQIWQYWNSKHISLKVQMNVTFYELNTATQQGTQAKLIYRQECLHEDLYWKKNPPYGLELPSPFAFQPGIEIKKMG